MQDAPQRKSRLNTVLIVLLCIAAIPIVPYLILLAVIVEVSVIGTTYIQSMMELTGTIEFFVWWWDHAPSP